MRDIHKGLSEVHLIYTTGSTLRGDFCMNSESSGADLCRGNHYLMSIRNKRRGGFAKTAIKRHESRGRLIRGEQDLFGYFTTAGQMCRRKSMISF